MEKEKEEYIKAFLDGELSLDEILEAEGKTLFDFDLPFSALISVSSTPLKKTYRFTVDAHNYMAGVTSEELDDAYMQSFGFKDYGVVGGPKESEEFHCHKCNKTWSTFDMEEDLYEQLITGMLCPQCGQELEYIAIYEHVHLEGSKTVRLWKTTVQRLIERSETITEFAEKLLEKVGIY